MFFLNFVKRFKDILNETIKSRLMMDSSLFLQIESERAS